MTVKLPRLPFFFVSGLFVKSSIDKRSSSHFIVDKLKVVLYPYLLWALIGQLSGPLTQRWRMNGSSSWLETWHQPLASASASLTACCSRPGDTMASADRARSSLALPLA